MIHALYQKYTFILLAAAFLPHTAWANDSTMIRFDFTSSYDDSGTYKGMLMSHSSLSTYEGLPVLSLGTGGYFRFPNTLGEYVNTLSDYSVSVNVLIPSDSDISGAGNFIWCFAKSSTAGYLFLSAKDTRFAITETTYTGEQTIGTSAQLQKGRWVSTVFIQKDDSAFLYVAGSLAASGVVTLKPDQLETLHLNYLGRSCYGGDALLANAMMNDFRLYNYAIESDSISAMSAEISTLNATIDAEAVKAAVEEFDLGDLSELREDITLPTTYYNDLVDVSWQSSDESVITSTGHITRPAEGQPKATAVLTATFTTPTLSEQRSFDVGVMPEFSTQDAMIFAADHITIGGNRHNLYSALTLPTDGEENTVIMWSSGDTNYLSDDGRVVRRGSEKQTVTLTATFLKDGETYQRLYDVTIHEQEPYAGYLFTFFPSNSDENIYYALSSDGYNYTVLNNDSKVIASDTTTVMGGLRDPHILRGKDDGYFYMVATDMKCSLGWESNRGIVLMRSKDLINWENHTVYFPTRYQGTTFANVTRVWAPETIWDSEAGKYMVYYSIKTSDSTASYDKVYYSYANDDFSDLSDEPVYLYDRGSATIDMDIVYNESDSLYHAFFKNEGEGGICSVTAESLTPADGGEAGSQWSDPSGTLQQTTVSVEGAGVFKLINEDSWILMYDCYTSGYYQFCSSADLDSFSFVKNTSTSGAFTPRHGTVIQLTEDEMDTLVKTYPPSSSVTPSIEGSYNVNVRQDMTEISGDTVTLPVTPGTDLSRFDPYLYAAATCSVTPSGEQDFSSGAVTYTVTNGEGESKDYRVRCVIYGNPVLPDFHADPEVLFSKKTGQFYIYPTTDGYSSWAGSYFNVYSSPDLVHFTSQGTILDLSAGGDCLWSSGYAWAPSIEEKWIDGAYRYYFFFSAENSSLNTKTLGVATASSPTGEFTCAEEPLFTSSAAGQMIDSDVFTDPVSGQTYLYYGNGKMCYRLLGDDLMSVEGSEYIITPSGGTLSTWAYREGTNVFYRNGIYYFLWSVDDTGSANYHVAYGTSSSPTGPITVADQPIVIIEDAAEEIYGTGHNSIVNIPETDDWYIIYHRINKNYLNNGPGYHREVCVDKLSFADDGTIIEVTPTDHGIDGLDMSAYRRSIITSAEESAVCHGSGGKETRVRYYTIDGRSLGENAPTAGGIFIRQERLSDNTLRNIKIVR